MFCTKCGKELYDDDKFCASCGAKVREVKRNSPQEVVFNPPFKIEAERRTYEISQDVNRKPAEEPEKKVDFDWNLDGFPDYEHKKTDEVDFDWGAVIEKRKRAQEAVVNKIEIQPSPWQEPEPAIDDLLKSGTDKEAERFYTYNQKKEAFQSLLDKEYARVKALGEDKPEEPKPESEPEIEQDTQIEVQSEAEPDTQIEVQSEIEPDTQIEAQSEAEPEASVVSVSAPITPATIDLTKIYDVNAENTENTGNTEDNSRQEASQIQEWEPAEQQVPEETCTPSTGEEKSKLRYSDIFPAESVVSRIDADSNPYGDLDDDDDEKKVKKTNIFVKLIVGLLTILILLEGVILVSKIVAPESKFSQKTDQIISNILNKFTGGEENDGGNSGDDVVVNTFISDEISQISGTIVTIGQVAEDPSLKYDMTKTYAFEETYQTKDFQNSDWHEGTDGVMDTYGGEIVRTVISYYDRWKDTNTNTNLIGINKLEIGEIRTGGEGYYVLCRITYADKQSEEQVKYATAYVKISQETMVLNEIKEENL